MNRREEERAAQARKAAAGIFRSEKKNIPRVLSEREDELAAQALKTSRLRALRLAQAAVASDEQKSPRKPRT
jgi:hypothetical protein